MNMYAAALSALETAVSLAVNQDQSTTETLTRLRQSILRDRSRTNRRRLARETDEHRRQTLIETARRQALKAKSNYIHLLPRDVLMCIADQGVAVRMGMVCKDWRESVCSQPGLWSCLTFGMGRSVMKARMWMERSQGWIRELTFTADFDVSKTEELVGVLKGCLGGVEILTITGSESTGTGTVVNALRGRFSHLRKLVVRNRPNGKKGQIFSSLYLDLLVNGAKGLRHIEIGDVRLDMSNPGNRSDSNLHSTPVTETPPDTLDQLDTIRLNNCSIVSSRESLVDVLRRCPAIRDVSLTNSYWVGPYHPGSSQEVMLSLELPNLEKYAGPRHLEVVSFERIRAPRLMSLDLAGYHNVLNEIRAPGLLLARPNLTSLDIGASSVDQEHLLDVLADLPKLRFLNVSYCGLDNGFIEALARTDNPLLPQLTALSIAGNETIRPATVRDLVNSRLPPSLQFRHPQSAKTIKRVSSFLPSQPNQLPTATPILNPVISQSNSQANLRNLTWLNLDHCQQIDDTVARLLRKRVRFVTAASTFVATVDNRIRGKGDWAWDADWTERCGNGEDNVCNLMRVPGTCRRYLR